MIFPAWMNRGASSLPSLNATFNWKRKPDAGLAEARAALQIVETIYQKSS